MKILAIEKEIDSGKDFQPYLKAEAEKVWKMQQSGILREIYFTKEEHCAVLVLECSNKSEAQQILSDLPLVKEGLIYFEVHELLPYDGFERLFNGHT